MTEKELKMTAFESDRLASVRQAFLDLPEEWMRTLTREMVKRGSWDENGAKKFLDAAGVSIGTYALALREISARTGWFSDHEHGQMVVNPQFEPQLQTICYEAKAGKSSK